MSIKCIVKGCTNKSSEGKFIGQLCSPCYEILTTGKVTPTNSILKDLKNNKFKLSEKQIKHLLIVIKEAVDKYVYMDIFEDWCGKDDMLDEVKKYLEEK